MKQTNIKPLNAAKRKQIKHMLEDAGKPGVELAYCGVTTVTFPASRGLPESNHYHIHYVSKRGTFAGSIVVIDDGIMARSIDRVQQSGTIELEDKGVQALADAALKMFLED